jgi:hypothetical protein
VTFWQELLHLNRQEPLLPSRADVSTPQGQDITPDPLAALRAEFDRELAVLNDPQAAAKFERLFAASTADMGRAANAADRRRKQ